MWDRADDTHNGKLSPQGNLELFVEHLKHLAEIVWRVFDRADNVVQEDLG